MYERKSHHKVVARFESAGSKYEVVENKRAQRKRFILICKAPLSFGWHEVMNRSNYLDLEVAARIWQGLTFPAGKELK